MNSGASSSLSRTLVAFFLGWLVCGFPAGYDSTTSPARLLDRVCPTSCTVSGSARQTALLSGDSVGYVVGPGPGELSIRLAASLFGTNRRDGDHWEVDILADGQGTISGGPTDGLAATFVPAGATDPVWMPIASGTWTFVPDGSETGLPPASVTFAVRDASVLRILDLRITTGTPIVGDCGL